MKLLLSYGASLELKAAHGYRPVHLAAIRGARLAMLLLLNRQAQPDPTDDDGARAAHAGQHAAGRAVRLP